MASITVHCPCGVEFERPIQRGRPAIWCPECRTLPMGQRPEKPATVVVVKTVNESGEETVTEVKAERTVSRYGQHDVFSFNERETIEEGMARLNAEYKNNIYPNRETLFAASADPARAASDWLFDQTTALYKSVRKVWWQNSSSKEAV
jgi:hypothetical protein